jgi:electron transfer flavoprotein beta subunit
MTGLVLLQAGMDSGLGVDPPGAAGDRDRRGGVVPNLADRAALECALTLTARVLALTVGPVEHECALHLARARGAVGAVRLWDPVLAAADAVAMARVLAAAVMALGPAVVLTGVRGLEGATGSLPPLLAARLGWPCLQGVGRLRVEGDRVVVGERPAAGGRREEVEAAIPAVVMVRPESGEAPYVAYRARRAAARDPVECWSLQQLGLDAATVHGWVRSEVEAVDWPRPRPRRTAGPPAARSAAERLRQLVSGGPKPAAPRSRLLEGPPDDVAGQVIAFLEGSGFHVPAGVTGRAGATPPAGDGGRAAPP